MNDRMVFHAIQVNMLGFLCGNARFAMREWCMGEKVNIPETLLVLRKNAKLSQEGLAELSGIGRSTLQDIERGLSSPTVATLELIATALKIPLIDFFPKSSDPNVVTIAEVISLLGAFEKAAPERRAFALFLLTGDREYLGNFDVAHALEALTRAK